MQTYLDVKMVTETRDRTRVVRLVELPVKKWKPSEHTTVKKVMSDKRPAENQEDAWHFREETAKLDFHPDNKEVKKGHTAAAAQGLDP